VPNGCEARRISSKQERRLRPAARTKKQFHFPECNETFAGVRGGTHLAQRRRSSRRFPDVVPGSRWSVIFTPHSAHGSRHLQHDRTRRRRKPDCGIGTHDLIVRSTRGSRSCGCEGLGRRTKDTTARPTSTLGREGGSRARCCACGGEDNWLRGASGVAGRTSTSMVGFDENDGLIDLAFAGGMGNGFASSGSSSVGEPFAAKSRRRTAGGHRRTGQQNARAEALVVRPDKGRRVMAL